MEEKGREPLEAFNRLYKQMDECYHAYARSQGLSDAALWLLYCLNESGPCTQRELCAAWSYPPQTINSALKSLVAKGVLALSSLPGDRKSKRIALTPAGRQLLNSSIAPLVAAERRAFLALNGEERQALLALTGRYAARLQAEVAACIKQAAPPSAQT